MTLGGGGYGGNITSDNISPRHLLNIKRLAYELTPVASLLERRPRPMDRPPSGQREPVSSELPVAAAKAPVSAGISAGVLTRRIDEFLGSRGFAGGRVSLKVGEKSPSAASDPPPLEFVCEEDVRLAIEAGRKLVVAERAIVTPAARDLGEQHRIFAVAPWRG